LTTTLFAIDGCKMASDAAKTWSGTFKELGEKRDKLKRLIKHHKEEHARCDGREVNDSAKEKRLQQTIDTLNQKHRKIQPFLANEPRIGSGKDEVQGQWQLYCLVHNIEKLANYGNLGRWNAKARQNWLNIAPLSLTNTLVDIYRWNIAGREGRWVTQ